MKEMGASIVLVVLGALLGAGMSLLISSLLQTEFQVPRGL